jgi:plasmid stabilization system protein ParE
VAISWQLFPVSAERCIVTNGPGIRELVETPYRILYRIRRETVEIIDVFHSAQLPPWER